MKISVQLTSLLLLPRIRIQILLLHLPLHIHIMTKLTLRPLITMPRLIKHAQHRLWIDPEGHFLRLRRLKEGSFFLLATLLFELGFGAEVSFFFFGKNFGGFAGL
jgi:hypothetical protein